MHEIISIKQIEDFIQQARIGGKTNIVFTNGCFDILHRGHVDLLEKAKALGDILVLGLNSDDSIRRLKGEERPLVKEADRAFILSRLESVDVVCIFEEDTPLDLIRKVKPDILVKGGDYTIETIVGYEIVQQYDGKVLTIPLISGRSTTNVLNKIKNLTR